MENIIFDKDDKEGKTYTIDLSNEDNLMLAQLAEHLKNSKAGAMRYAIKYCHRIFVKEKAS